MKQMTSESGITNPIQILSQIGLKLSVEWQKRLNEKIEHNFDHFIRILSELLF